MTPLVVAHRGASWDARENTLDAFELAIEQGADYVEFDVRLASEGTLVLCHEPVPERTADLCTLDDALERLRGRVGLAVEIKDARAAEPTMRALRKHRARPDEVIVLSFRIRALETARRFAPETRMALNLGPRPDPAAAGRYWGVGFGDAVAKPRGIGLAQSLGLATLVFTVNEPTRMLELAELGVDAIVTDRPALLRETLAARVSA
jgi:glycerophosphoryl diester phosphodiesterase